ncbi:MAG TPA: hypothetical protein VEX68_25245 [Bryobacteraceae bacterium]|nr:hypothetical protein [Bryobacteraceae bacterium]
MRVESKISRRDLLAGVAAVPLLSNAQTRPARPKIAAITTTYFKYSHAQHIVDRFLEGYGWNGTHHYPAMDLVSLFVDQVNDRDWSRDRARRFPTMKVYPTIAEALTLGGSKLAVDGIVVVGEHGKYPRTEKGQTKYPRYEFFQEIFKVFRASGRSVPVFNDKHLSWNWPWAKEIYDTAREMGFAFMAGSSLPVTWRTPSLEMPAGARVSEAMCVCYGGVDSYDFHGLETLQCMVERRKGGETGVRWLQAYRGDNFWKAYKEGVWPKDLVEAALCRSHTLTPARDGFNNILPTMEDMQRLVKNPVAYRYEHVDGLKSTMLLMSGLVKDFNFSARLDKGLFSTQMYLPMPDGRTTLANFFSPLVNGMEQMFLTGKPTYPVERTLLTTGLTSSGVDSLFDGQERLETPHLAIKYQPTRESTFWRT